MWCMWCVVVYVCVCARVCICAYVCVGACVHMCMYVGPWVRARGRSRVHGNVFVWCMCVYFVYVCTFSVCVYICAILSTMQCDYYHREMSWRQMIDNQDTDNWDGIVMLVH